MTPSPKPAATYTTADTQRMWEEKEKPSQLVPTNDQARSAFSRDRARVLHSAALRRLADKTQVVGPRTSHTPRTRLTHSLEVGQIARGIGTNLRLDPDLCEMAGLTHDIGHPPYGHNGEVALNNIATHCGGFEGNAQTLRILSYLEPKVLDHNNHSYGLNLTRASLDAACKYPRTKTNPDGTTNRKYSCYDEDTHILTFVRHGHTDHRPPMEAQVMDFSDDIAYSVHDVEDGIISGRINLSVLWDFVELAELAEKGCRAFGGTPTQLITAADSLRELPIINHAADFTGTLTDYSNLTSMTSQLVGRYVGAITDATLNHPTNTQLGRTHGQLIVPDLVWAEVTLLKTIAVLYVMDDPAHLRLQDRQRDRIYAVYDYLTAGAPGTLNPMFRHWWEAADSVAARERVVIDQIASMTESELEATLRFSHRLSKYGD